MKMLIIKRGYQRKYQVGGSGIFLKLKDFLSGFISKKQVVDTALNIARSAGQKAGQKAIDFASSKLSPKSKQILSKLLSSTPRLRHRRHSRRHQIWTTWQRGRGSARSKYKTLSNGWINNTYYKWTILNKSRIFLKSLKPSNGISMN